MKRLMFLGMCCIYFTVHGQSVLKKLNDAIASLEADSQCCHGLISLYVVNTKTGKVFFDMNSETGLAPASCQKVITSVTAFDMLGKNYTYKTNISIDGMISDGELNGNVYITGAGDPTTGSWRYDQTKEDKQLRNITDMLTRKNIKKINGNIIVTADGWSTQATPGGWTWDDMGNYYGAGPWAMNWNENQFDIEIAQGKKPGDETSIIKTLPELYNVNLVNELTTGEARSGDNTIIYLPERGTTGYLRGTVPTDEKSFIISGAIPDAPLAFLYLLKKYLLKNKITCSCKLVNMQDSTEINALHTNSLQKIGELISPPFDSINYWFLKRSINLYGEALVKTIAFEKKKSGTTDSGLNIIKDYWTTKGIDRSAIKMIDGSGLSPGNRITANTLVTVMQYAKQQPWYTSFYNALPETNGIKMKSGSIGGVLAYTGYIKNKEGNEYTFSFIINNYNGSGSLLKTKMWKLLDILK